MAKKYGTGATSGKKATTYMATAPNGEPLKKKSFFIHTDTALIGAFKHEGKWVATGVTDKIQDWGSQQFFEAKRVI